MDIRPALQIQTVIKTLTDVVLPAVDPSNKLAIEQARLAIGTLNIVLQRQALMYLSLIHISCEPLLQE